MAIEITTFLSENVILSPLDAVLHSKVGEKSDDELGEPPFSSIDSAQFTT